MRGTLQEYLVKTMNRFSVGWFVWITLFNLIGTAVLGFMAFGAAMSAFSASGGQAAQRVHLIESISWIWSTGPMIASHFGLLANDAMIGLIILWPFIVGTIGGFVVPRISK
jgi:hypothetical protein